MIASRKPSHGMEKEICTPSTQQLNSYHNIKRIATNQSEEQWERLGRPLGQRGQPGGGRLQSRRGPAPLHPCGSVKQTDPLRAGKGVEWLEPLPAAVGVEADTNTLAHCLAAPIRTECAPRYIPNRNVGQVHQKSCARDVPSRLIPNRSQLETTKLFIWLICNFK